jgi:hypothetical protein
MTPGFEVAIGSDTAKISQRQPERAGGRSLGKRIENEKLLRKP